MNRRKFLARSGSCAAHLVALGAFSSLASRRVFAAPQDSKTVADEKWGRLEEVSEGVWVLVSTPFKSRDFTTVCNGGIIKGSQGVLAVEAFMQPKGANWLAEQAKKLTGKRPTDVVATHYHGDHINGHHGYAKGTSAPKLWLTESTQAAASQRFKDSNVTTFGDVNRLNAEKPTTIDLGDRSVQVVPRRGHTKSDVTIEVADPKIVWCGDLFFNRMFPNYADATPNLLNEYAKELTELDHETAIVPGHGPIADQTAVAAYQEFLAFVQKTATEAHESKIKADQAAEKFKLPKNLEDWVIWSPKVAKDAMNAWYRVFAADKK